LKEQILAQKQNNPITEDELNIQAYQKKIEVQKYERDHTFRQKSSLPNKSKPLQPLNIQPYDILVRAEMKPSEPKLQNFNHK
jgi:hypothetical protein